MVLISGSGLRSPRLSCFASIFGQSTGEYWELGIVALLLPWLAYAWPAVHWVSWPRSPVHGLEVPAFPLGADIPAVLLITERGASHDRHASHQRINSKQRHVPGPRQPCLDCRMGMASPPLPRSALSAGPMSGAANDDPAIEHSHPRASISRNATVTAYGQGSEWPPCFPLFGLCAASHRSSWPMPARTSVLTRPDACVSARGPAHWRMAVCGHSGSGGRVCHGSPEVAAALDLRICANWSGYIAFPRDCSLSGGCFLSRSPSRLDLLHCPRLENFVTSIHTSRAPVPYL
jgi:hypothetical protein